MSLLKKETLSKDLSIFTIHGKMIVIAIVLFIFTIIAALIIHAELQYSIKIKQNLGSKQSEYLNKQSQYERYFKLYENMPEIINQMKNIQKIRLFVSNFDDNAFLKQIISGFSDKFKVLANFDLKDTDCKNILKDIQYHEFMKCKKVILSIDRFSEEGVVGNLDEYINAALPGFVFSDSINLTHSINRNEYYYSSKLEYSWLYFVTNI